MVFLHFPLAQLHQFSEGWKYPRRVKVLIYLTTRAAFRCLNPILVCEALMTLNLAGLKLPRFSGSGGTG